LLDRFPSARAIATPKTVNAMQMSFTPVVERLARRMFPGQVATKLVAPEPYEHDTFTLEAVSYTHLDVYKRQHPSSFKLAPSPRFFGMTAHSPDHPLRIGKPRQRSSQLSLSQKWSEQSIGLWYRSTRRHHLAPMSRERLTLTRYP